MPNVLLGLVLLGGVGLALYILSTRTTKPLAGAAPIPEAGLEPAQRTRLDRFADQLARYYQIDLMNRYATLKFDLPGSAQEALLARYPRSDRVRPEFPFSLAESQRLRMALLPALRELVEAKGGSPRGNSETDLLSDLEDALSWHAHLDVLAAIEPHLPNEGERQKWDALKRERPVVSA